ncbi:hypothetical protein FPW41_07610 [Vibrio cholerae]|uniref:hypothetical protein n=1 Tax=Vibrio cholerae TaxID=666 RepID=UPI0011837ACC|nr:hypothetical protein [Vibrio cholerae]TVN38339.1 hypothetical protein FPW41_07610 [Vibrio cholerae]
MTETCEKFTDDMMVSETGVQYFRKLNIASDNKNTVIAVYPTQEDKEKGTNLLFIAEETRISPHHVHGEILWGEDC